MSIVIKKGKSQGLVKKKQIIEQFENGTCDERALFADGYDNAIIGIDYKSSRIIYSYKKCLEILGQSYPPVGEGTLYGSQNERNAAILDDFRFNALSAYVGDFTPIWCMDEAF